MNWEDVALVASELTALRFFPTDDNGRLAVMKLIGRMASDEQQVRWLVARTMDLFDDWPGPRTLRMIFCKRFRPADGIEVSGFCEQYPDGIPSEKKLEAPILALPPGCEVTSDPELDQTLIEIAEQKRMPAGVQTPNDFTETLENIVTPPMDRKPLSEPTPQIITAEDVERAVQEHRKMKSKDGTVQ